MQQIQPQIPVVPVEDGNGPPPDQSFESLMQSMTPTQQSELFTEFGMVPPERLQQQMQQPVQQPFIQPQPQMVQQPQQVQQPISQPVITQAPPPQQVQPQVQQPFSPQQPYQVQQQPWPQQPQPVQQPVQQPQQPYQAPQVQQPVQPQVQAQPQVQQPQPVQQPAQPQQPVGPNPREQELLKQNYTLRQNERKLSDERLRDNFLAEVGQDLMNRNWQPEQQQLVHNVLKTVIDKDHEVNRAREDIVDGAFRFGRQYNLNLDQIERLSQAPTTDAFNAMMSQFAQGAPSPQTVALQQQVQQLQGQVQQLTRGQVPYGQQFGIGQMTPATGAGQGLGDGRNFFNDLVEGNIPQNDENLRTMEGYLDRFFAP